MLATASWDKSLALWDPSGDRDRQSLSGHTDIVTGCRFTPDGCSLLSWSHDGTRIASASDDRTVQVWDVATRHTLYTYRGHADVLNAVAWSHNDKYIATGSGDYTVHILGAATGNRISAYSGHSLAVHAVGWSNDDLRVASASDDHTVQVWKAM